MASLRRYRSKLKLHQLETRDLPAIVAAPGFEVPALSAGQFAYAPASTPWSFSPAAGVSSNFSPFTASNAAAPEGKQVGFLQGKGSVSQVVTLTGGTYLINFMAAQRANVPSKQTLNVLVDGQLVGSYNNLTNTFYAPQASTNFPGSAGTHTITFQATNLFGGDNTMLIDQVTINEVMTDLIDTGFEVPGLSPGTFKYVPTGSAWSFGPGSGISQNNSGFTGVSADAPQGSQVAFLQNKGSVSQVVTLTAGTYSIAFSAAQRGNQRQSLEVLVTGTLVGNYDSIIGPNYNQQTTSTFTVATGPQTITFQGTNIFGGDNTAFIDDVAIHIEPARFNDSGFELAGLARGTFKYQPAGTPWSFAGPAGITANVSPFNGSNPPAPQGGEVAFVQQKGSVTQIAAFSPGTYEIGFLAAQRSSKTAQTFQLAVDGVVVGTYNRLAGTSYSALVSSSFTVPSGNHTITFVGTNLNGGDNTVFIDHVTIQPQSTSLTDTGFEQPVLANGTFKYQAASPNWTYLGTAGISANGSAFTNGNPGTPQGNQVLFLQQSGSARQAVTFDAGTYEINFLAAQRANGTGKQQTLNVLVNGIVVTSFNGLTNTGYTPLSTTSFTVGAGSHTVTFQGTNLKGGDNTVFIDDVAIIKKPVNLNDSGFEFPSLALNAFKYAPTGTPWSYTGTSGIAANGSTITGGNPGAPQGTQALFLQQLGSVSQVVTFSEGTFGLSFLAAQRGNIPSVQTLQVLLDGIVIGTFNNISGKSYSQQSTPNFTVAAGNHTITFKGTNLNGGDNTILVDQVTVI